MVKFTSTATMLASRVAANVDTVLPLTIAGQDIEVPKVVVNGEMETLEFTMPIGEMLTSAQGSEQMLRKAVLDVDLGREQTPLLYKSIYRTLIDPNMPKIVDTMFATRGTVIFTKWQEGEEIKFGALEADEGPGTAITTFAAGFEYTEDMVVYNDTFSMSVLQEAFGEAYNALLNHTHLYPIFTFSYKTANTTNAVTAATGDYALERNTITTLRNGLNDARIAKRPGTILLASSKDQMQIEAAFSSYVVNATPFPGITDISEVIFYDGWSTTVGKKTYTYEGVPKGSVFLIRPKRGMIELIKHDLKVDSALADLSRLIAAQVVGRARRGAYIALEDNVQKIKLPTA